VVPELSVTVRLPVVVVEGESRLLPTVLPMPHSYTASEPAFPPLAVNVMVVGVPSHIVEMSDVKLAGAEGGVLTVANTAVRDADTQPVVRSRECA
jgi:hypothetical protein